MFFCVVGLCLLTGAAFSIASTLRYLRESVVVPGRVIKLNAGGSHPEIAFTTLKGERLSYPQGGLIGGYRVGDRVRVRYREAHPIFSASLDVFGAVWTFPIFLLVLGIPFALTPLGVKHGWVE